MTILKCQLVLLADFSNHLAPSLVKNKATPNFSGAAVGVDNLASSSRILGDAATQ